MDSSATQSRVVSASSRPAHLLALDGFRGFAVLLVLLYHLLITNEHPGSRLVTFLVGVRVSLWVGVDMFLALSGFLITGILFDALGSRHHLRNFYARRCLRLLPVYWLAIAVLTYLAFRYHVAWWWSAARLFVFLQNTPVWFHHPAPFPLSFWTSHLWSLALEEQFYLCWPVLMVLLRDRRRIMSAALILAVIALLCRLWLVHSGASYELTYKMLPCRMDGFLLGGWLALAWRGREREQVLQRPAILFGLAMVCLVLLGMREHGLEFHVSHLVNGPGYTVVALACSSLLAMTLRAESRTQRFFRRQGLRWLGRYSYGIYVWHVILGQSITAPARTMTAHITANKGVQMLVGAAVTAGVSLLLGVVSFHAVEVPFLRLKRLFPKSPGTPSRMPQPHTSI